VFLQKISSSLFQKESLSLISILIAFILGVFAPGLSLKLEFLGTIFINLLKTILVPLVFISVTNSILGLPDKKLLKKIGSRVIAYFLLTTSLASITGMFFTYLFFRFFAKNSWIENFRNLDLESGVNLTNSQLFQQTSAKAGEIINSVFLGIFPNNLVELLSGEKILGVILISILFGIACLNLENQEENKEPQEQIDYLKKFFKSLELVIMKIADWVIKIAPLGILGVISSFVAKNGLGRILELKSFFLFIVLACLTHAFFSLALVARLIGKFNLFSYFIKVKEALLIAFATASSCATIPVSMRVSKKAGVRQKTASFVLPIGATINMDGSALYQPMCLIFITKVANLEVSLASLVIVFLAGILGSIGTSGVPWGSVVIVSSILLLIGVPAQYISLFIIIDRFLDFFITSINVWGDLVACKIIDNNLELELHSDF